MWWIYFHKGAEAGSEQISRSSEPGRLARLAYTYLHMPIVAGIIVSAVADELVLKHPAGHSDLRTVLSAIGGPLLFLVGTILFKHSFRGFLQLSHGVGIIALGVLAWFAGELSPLMLSDSHVRDHDRGRAVGIDLAGIGRGGIAYPELLLADHIAQHDIGQLHHECPQPGIFLKQGCHCGIRVSIQSVSSAARIDDEYSF